MARFSQNLSIPRFAYDGIRVDPDATGTPNSVVSRELGLDQAFSQVGGKRPDYRAFNQMFYEMTSLFNYVNQTGLPLPWSQDVDYVDPAFVKGSNGRIYISVRNSGPTGGNATDPIDDPNRTYWDVY